MHHVVMRRHAVAAAKLLLLEMQLLMAKYML
jgi:hypothetical protein